MAPRPRPGRPGRRGRYRRRRPSGPGRPPRRRRQAVPSVLVLIIGAGLLLAMARRQIALPALLDLRGPHRPG